MKNSSNLARQAAAEFVGSFLLVLVFAVGTIAVDISQQYAGFYLPLWMGLTLALGWYMFHMVSGAHFNPVVTLTMFVLKVRTLVETVAYLAVQLLASYAAIAVAKHFLGTPPSGLHFIGLRAGFFIEAAGAFMLMLAYVAILKKMVSPNLAALVLGVAYSIALTVTLAISGGIINPATALVLQANTMVYIVSPIAGGLVGALFATWLYREPTIKQNEEN